MSWWKEIAKWVQEEQACNNDSGGDDLGDVTYVWMPVLKMVALNP